MLASRHFMCRHMTLEKNILSTFGEYSNQSWKSYHFEQKLLASRWRVVQHTIDTGDSPPIKQPFEENTIRTPSSSGCNDPRDAGTESHHSFQVPVRKKDGGLRFCVDYRRLNSVTKLDEFHFPVLTTHMTNLLVLSSLQPWKWLLATGRWRCPHKIKRRLPLGPTLVSLSSGRCHLHQPPFSNLWRWFLLTWWEVPVLSIWMMSW